MAWSGKLISAGFHDQSARAHSKADGISELRVQFATGGRSAGLLRALGLSTRQGVVADEKISGTESCRAFQKQHGSERCQRRGKPGAM